MLGVAASAAAALLYAPWLCTYQLKWNENNSDNGYGSDDQIKMYVSSQKASWWDKKTKCEL